MLPIVVDRIDAVVSGHAAREQPLEFLERDGHTIEGFAGPADRE